MNCRLCKQHMYSYFDSEIYAQEKQDIDRHIARCSSCRFQYELTRQENLILQDVSHIPDLSPDFDQRVLNAIKIQPVLPPEEKMLSKPSLSRRYNLPLFARAAAAVVLLALCISIPGILLPGQEKIEEKSDRIIAESKCQLKLPAGSADFSANTVAVSETNQKDAGMVVNTAAQIKAPLPDEQDLRLSVNPAPDTALLVSSVVPPKSFDVGRGERKIASYAPPSWSLKNIPAQYQLQYITNANEYQSEYNYLTADGTRKLTVKIVSVSAQNKKESISSLKTPPPDSLSAQLEAPASVSRETQIGNNIINLTLSGNLGYEELTQIASHIEIIPGH